MESHNCQIGKVRTFDEFVGEIVSSNGVYLFTKEGILEGEKINPNDMVVFRGEEVTNTKKAFFIKKITPNKSLEEVIYKKTKTPRKENE